MDGSVGFELFDALSPLGRWIPDGANGALEGAVGAAAMRSGRVFETYPDAIFCALLGHRPSPKRTPWGLQQRIAALKLKGVYDDDGGLWHRTLDELDACAAAYAAYAHERRARAPGSAIRTEGVIVHPDRRAARPSYDEAARPGALRAGLTRGLHWVWMANGDNGVRRGAPKQRAYCIGASPDR